MTSLKDIKAPEFILFSIFSAECIICIYIYIYFEALGIKLKNLKVVWANVIYVNISHTCVYIVYIFICIIS